MSSTERPPTPPANGPRPPGGTGATGKTGVGTGADTGAAANRSADPTGEPATGEPAARRWMALVFIGLAQLIVVLDVTVVNIALPSAQADLGVSDANRQWIITAYTLAFGSLLLVGGRVADHAGRRRALLIGLTGFAAASALGGAAGSFGLLLAARALQGVFAALLAPATLSLLAVMFTRPAERAKAFGIFGAIAAGGNALGLVLGGVLTEYLDWRWCMYVNVPLAAAAGAGLLVFLRETPGSRGGARIDVAGAALVSGGIVAIVYACSIAESDGWGSATVTGLLAGGAALLAVFVLVERRAADPLLPLRVVLDRTRGGAYVAVALATVGMFAMFLFLTYYLQVVKGWTPVRAGTAFLPMSVAVLAGAGGVATRVLPYVPPRALITPGLLLAAAGMGWLGRLDADSSYAQGVLPAQLLIGFGMGLVMAPAMNYATHRVPPEDAGIASATANTGQQMAGSIGTALLNTIATSATADRLGDGPRTPESARSAMVHGFSVATTWAAVILLGTAVIVALLMNTPRPERAELPGEPGDPAPGGDIERAGNRPGPAAGEALKTGGAE